MGVSGEALQLHAVYKKLYFLLHSFVVVGIVTSAVHS